MARLDEPRRLREQVDEGIVLQVQLRYTLLVEWLDYGVDAVLVVVMVPVEVLLVVMPVEVLVVVLPFFLTVRLAVRLAVQVHRLPI